MENRRVKLPGNVIEKEKKNDVVRDKQNLQILDILKLTEIRHLVNLKLKLKPPPIFKQIFQKAKYMVSSWGGSMYFIYLPSYSRYSLDKEDVYRDYVMKTVKELDIPLIDIHKEVFELHPDPFSLFPFRIFGHYNADGYRLVAEAIYQRLINDGIKVQKWDHNGTNNN